MKRGKNLRTESTVEMETISGHREDVKKAAIRLSENEEDDNYKGGMMLMGILVM